MFRVHYYIKYIHIFQLDPSCQIIGAFYFLSCEILLAIPCLSHGWQQKSPLLSSKQLSSRSRCLTIFMGLSCMHFENWLFRFGWILIALSCGKCSYALKWIINRHFQCSTFFFFLKETSALNTCCVSIYIKTYCVRLVLNYF